MKRKECACVKEEGDSVLYLQDKEASPTTTTCNELYCAKHPVLFRGLCAAATFMVGCCLSLYELKGRAFVQSHNHCS